MIRRFLPAVLAILFGLNPVHAQQSATSSVAVLSVGRVLSQWTEYQDIIRYVGYVLDLDREDLEKMQQKAIELGKEAERNYDEGDLSEKDYEIQRSTVRARLQKLKHYWEIREEIVNSRLEEDRERRLQMMQNAVNDLAKSKGFDIILKDRSMVYYDKGFEVAPEISRSVNRMSKEETDLFSAPAGIESASAGETPSATEP